MCAECSLDLAQKNAREDARGGSAGDEPLLDALAAAHAETASLMRALDSIAAGLCLKGDHDLSAAAATASAHVSARGKAIRGVIEDAVLWRRCLRGEDVGNGLGVVWKRLEASVDRLLFLDGGRA